ncbi:MAG: lysozyme inhibitor LprI family protein [Parafilimonas sp.]
MFRVAQRIWIQFRDAQMDMKYPERETGYYGSIQPLCWYSYKENLTKNRIDFLNEWMKGVQEGDACSGSIQIKN